MAYLTETLREPVNGLETLFIEFQDAFLSAEKKETAGDGIDEEMLHDLAELLEQISSKNDDIKELLEEIVLNH